MRKKEQKLANMKENQKERINTETFPSNKICSHKVGKKK